MKKLIIILGLVGCSDKRAELIKEIESDTLITQDTMITSFANQLKGISKSIETKNVHHQKSKDSMSKQLKKMHSKANDLEYENNVYRGALDGYSEIINTEGVQDAYYKAMSKDTTK
jgi:hypothetical protein